MNGPEASPDDETAVDRSARDFSTLPEDWIGPGEGADEEAIVLSLRECARDLDGLWDDRPPGGEPVAPEASGPPSAAGPPRRIGRFELLGKLGQGGFGLVYRARDPMLNRDVALKLPRPDVLMTEALRRRFLREARAAATLDHPNIVPVYDAGEVGPICFIASALCDGPTLAAWLSASAGPVPARQATRLLEGLAAGVAHAHAAGVLHRDLKPSNILLQGRPDSAGLDRFVPKISDFGLAKIAEDEGGDVTRTDAPMGSPPYMSPEQALGRADRIGPGADIYALGAILYRILVGQPPFQAESRTELIHRLVEDDPISPRLLRPDLPRDLETICLTCLQKDPSRRYATALALADDLGRYLRGEPILACRTPAWEHALKWGRRRPWQAASAAMLAALIGSSACGAVWREAILSRHNRALKTALELAERHEASTQRVLYGSRVRLAQQAASAGEVEFAHELLEKLRPGDGQADLRGFEWPYLRRVCNRDVAILATHESDVAFIALSPDGRTLASVDREGTIVLWDLPGSRERTRLPGPGFGVHRLAFSPDGRTLASWSVRESEPSVLKVRDADSGTVLAAIAGDWAGIHSVAYRRDGRILAIRGMGRDGRNQVQAWDSALGRRVAILGRPAIDCDALAYTPDGRLLVTAGPDGAVTLRDPEDWSVHAVLPWRRTKVLALATTPDSRVLAVGHTGGIDVVEIASRRLLGSFPARMPPEIVISPDGRRLAARQRDGGMLILDDLAGNPRTIDPGGISARLQRLAFLPDGITAALSVGEESVALWDLAAGQSKAQAPARLRLLEDLACLPDGRSIAFTIRDSRVRLWAPDTRGGPVEAVRGHSGEVWAVAYSPDGRVLYSAGDDHAIRAWDARDGRPLGVLSGHAMLVTSIAVSRDGRTLVSGSFDREIRVWDLATSSTRLILRGNEDKVRAVAISPDGSLIASGSEDKTVRIWDADTGAVRSVSEAHRHRVHAVAFHPSGRLLVSASTDRTLRGIDPERGTPLFSRTTPEHIMRMAFSPDGSLLASGDERGAIALWETAGWERVGSLKESDVTAWDLTFSPDGRRIAACYGDKTVRLWDPASGQALLVLEGHAARVNAVAFSPDGRTLASGSHDGAIRLWRSE